MSQFLIKYNPDLITRENESKLNKFLMENFENDDEDMTIDSYNDNESEFKNSEAVPKMQGIFKICHLSNIDTMVIFPVIGSGNILKYFLPKCALINVETKDGIVVATFDYHPCS